jgi:hypothetical protein
MTKYKKETKKKKDNNELKKRESKQIKKCFKNNKTNPKVIKFKHQGFKVISTRSKNKSRIIRLKM